MIMLSILVESDKMDSHRVYTSLQFVPCDLFSLGIRLPLNFHSTYKSLVIFVFALWTPVICASLFSITCLLGKDKNTNVFLVAVNIFTVCGFP